jgi:hypothetical protein
MRARWLGRSRGNSTSQSILAASNALWRGKKNSGHSSRHERAPGAALLTYEQLRAGVLNGPSHPEGLAAIVYHGMLRGLGVILTEATPNIKSSPPRICTSETVSFDRELLRLIANMVLQSQSQVMHVY